ncbi:MAG: hypothetical protein M1831_003513 [Alyxoria varia]|nr:MAG: hypothetical protein M1831_003513 [Alyxoria varia]
MPRSKRALHAAAQESESPPDSLPGGQKIVRVLKPAGSNLYNVEEPSTPGSLLVEMPSRFRSMMWVKKGSFVLVDTGGLASRDNKLAGEIVNVVRNEKEWRKQTYWPKEFTKPNISQHFEISENSSEVEKLPSEDAQAHHDSDNGET